MRSFGPYPTLRIERRVRLTRSGEPDPLNPRHWVTSPVVPQIPRRFCAPADAFGKDDARVRVWQPPTSSTDPKVWAEFREAVLQHAICIAVRRHKNKQGMTQERLADLDKRSHALDHWRAILNGRRLMTLEDIAFLMAHVPDAMPSAEAVTTLLRVAEHKTAPPPNWAEVDR